MSIAGTALAVVFSLPLALLAAPNTSPHPSVYFVVRTLLAFLRSVPECQRRSNFPSAGRSNSASLLNV
jgi:ABC-type phosphate/phosphonate transport system permease subunit